MLAQGTPDDVNKCKCDMEESFIGYIRQVEAGDIPADPQYIDFKITF
jgi:hypothetical protein